MYHFHGPTTEGFDFPVNYWGLPNDVDNAVRSFERTPEILEYLEELYGVPYPWIKFDRIKIPGIVGGAESTTATVLGHVTIYDELAEQDYPLSGRLPVKWHTSGSVVWSLVVNCHKHV